MDGINTLRYSDLFLAMYFDGGKSCLHRNHSHVLVYVYSGEMVIDEKGQITRLHKGECAFIRKDFSVQMTKQAWNGEQFKAIDLDPLGLVDDDRLDLLLGRLELGGELDLALLGGRLQLGRHRALAVDHAGRDEVVVDLLGLLVAQALLDAIIALDRDLREALRSDDAELEVLSLKLLLQAVGEVVVALVRDDGEHVRLWVVQALAILVHAQAQTAADLLALGQVVLCLDERADRSGTRWGCPSPP